MFGGRNGVPARRVHHHDAPGRGRRDIDIVHADPGAADHLEPGRGGQRLGGHFGRAPDDQGVEIADARDQLVLLEASAGLDLEMGALREDGNAFGGNAVSGQNAISCHPPTLSKRARNVKR